MDPLYTLGEDMSSTRIELEEPYKSLWRFGYLVTNKEPRRNVILYNSDSDRSTVSYARYLYSVSIGRLLESEYVVDHIDGNQMNDCLSNYQLLSDRDNVMKGYRQGGKTRLMVKFKCGGCGEIFTRKKNQTHLIIKTKKSTYCSRRCSSIKSREPSTVLEEYRR